MELLVVLAIGVFVGLATYAIRKRRYRSSRSEVVELSPQLRDDIRNSKPVDDGME